MKITYYQKKVLGTSTNQFIEMIKTMKVLAITLTLALMSEAQLVSVPSDNCVWRGSEYVSTFARPVVMMMMMY